MNRRWIMLFAAIACMGAFVQAQAQNTFNLQAAISAAQPGAVITAPAGTYGPIALKDDVLVVGEGGADACVIDAGGSACAVRAGERSALIGFSVRNAKVGVLASGTLMGLFECRVSDCAETAVRIAGGTAVLANNRIEGNREATGIQIMAANPYLANNYILNHAIGVQAGAHYVPTLVNNVFQDNVTAIQVGADTEVTLLGNLFDRNDADIVGQALGASDRVEAVDVGAGLPPVDGTLEGYGELMRVVFEQAVAMHPVVIYGLSETEGEFEVTTLFPWATFDVSAATPDTDIVAFEARDMVAQQALSAEFAAAALPTVRVRNDALTEKEQDRYALRHIYRHVPSYGFTEPGVRVFNRLTSFSNIELLIPDGWIPTALNLPAEFVWQDGHLAVKIVDVGHTRIELTLGEIAAGAQDVFNVLR